MKELRGLWEDGCTDACLAVNLDFDTRVFAVRFEFRLFRVGNLNAYRGASRIRNVHPPRTTKGPYA